MSTVTPVAPTGGQNLRLRADTVSEPAGETSARTGRKDINDDNRCPQGKQ